MSRDFRGLSYLRRPITGEECDLRQRTSSKACGVGLQRVPALYSGGLTGVPGYQPYGVTCILPATACIFLL